LGECHYVSGNERTAKRMPLLRNLLGYTGIHSDRLVLDWVSSAEAPKFAQVATEFTDTVRSLGPIEREINSAAIGA
jgi:F420-non-reducing hydrogenase iron-sulfur subunit